MNMFRIRRYPGLRRKWSNAMEQLLALCEGERIDPRMYIESIAETMGWWACNQKTPMTLQPSHCIGKGAASRYNRWLTREHNRQGRADIGQGMKHDTRLEAERVFIEAYALTAGLPHSERKRIATDAARSVRPLYIRCAKRRVEVLCEYLHRLHADLPDTLVLRRGWRVRDVFDVAERLLT